MKMFTLIICIGLIFLGFIYKDDVQEENEIKRGFYLKAGDVYYDNIYKSTK